MKRPFRDSHKIKTERELDALYGQAVGLQEAGQYDRALGLLTDLSMKSPAYRDVTIRIDAIKKRQELDQLFAAAESAYQAGRDLDAMAKYQEVTALNASHQREHIASRLFQIYMRLGSGLIEREDAAAEDVIQAEEYFSKALALQPRDAAGSVGAALRQPVSSRPRLIITQARGARGVRVRVHLSAAARISRR